jgi:general stress protein 26
MANDLQNSAKLRDALYDALDDERVGMLGLSGAEDHMQPMTHFFDREQGCVYFISSNKTDLARHLATGPRKAHFTVTSAKGELYACMSGPLTVTQDPEKLDELWSPMASMWFDGGKDDPEVVLLRLTLQEAAVWLNEVGALRFGLEMVRGATSDHDPEVGEHGVVNLRAA